MDNLSTVDIKNGFLKLLIFPFVLAILFLGLKIEKKIEWNWVLIFSPLIVFVLLFAGLYFFISKNETTTNNALIANAKNDPLKFTNIPTKQPDETPDQFAKRLAEYQTTHKALLA